MNAMLPVHDLLGIGFGPSNLALAVALLEEVPVHRKLDVCFLEKKPGFVWHGNMLLDDSRMQISFLKDLVTLRNPASKYTFINYLKQNGRLEAFINFKTFFPTRHEFNDYLSWVADDFRSQCGYGEEVVAVEPHMEKGDVTLLRVRSRMADGRERERLARNVVMGVGGKPFIPEVFAGMKDDARIFHSIDYLTAFESQRSPRRVAVIGAGQSAAEIFLDLHKRDPSIKVDLLSRAPALKPSDDSPFVNEIFHSGYTDFFFKLDARSRAKLLDNFNDTNYAVVDLNLIENIYELLYHQKVRGDIRHRYLAHREVRSVRADKSSITMDVTQYDTGVTTTHQYDCVVLATGFRRDLHRDILKPLEPHFESFEIQRDYRLRVDPSWVPSIYLQGCNEATHGLSDTLLSVLATRSKEIVDALLNRERVLAGHGLEVEHSGQR